jgi:hypothetical protein
MTRESFTEALQEELRRTRVHFKHADLDAFVGLHWHAIVRDPDVVRWAREFLDTGKGSVSV